MGNLEHRALIKLEDLPRTTRADVFALEAEMLKMPQIDVPLTHFFADGVYGRQGIIPKGCLITGRIHKQSQINIISAGSIAVIKGNGEPVEILTAPCAFVSPPGTKRVGYALEDCVFTTILGTHETEVSVIEDTLTLNTEEDYTEYLCLQSQQSLASPDLALASQEQSLATPQLKKTKLLSQPSLPLTKNTPI